MYFRVTVKVTVNHITMLYLKLVSEAQDQPSAEFKGFQENLSTTKITTRIIKTQLTTGLLVYDTAMPFQVGGANAFNTKKRITPPKM